MMLKNTCFSSPVFHQKCRLPSFYKADPNKNELALFDDETREMSDFIQDDISSCAGYSFGVDTSGLISF